METLIGIIILIAIWGFCKASTEAKVNAKNPLVIRKIEEYSVDEIIE